MGKISTPRKNLNVSGEALCFAYDPYVNNRMATPHVP